jgi:hypothetical protein
MTLSHCAFSVSRGARMGVIPIRLRAAALRLEREVRHGTGHAMPPSDGAIIPGAPHRAFPRSQQLRPYSWIAW